MDMALMHAGALPAALPVTLSDSVIRKFAATVAAERCVVTDPEQKKRLQRMGVFDVIDVSSAGLAEAPEAPRGEEVASAVRALMKTGLHSMDDKVAYISPSSGTTGESKGCCMTFGNARNFGSILSSQLSMSPQDRIFSFLPMPQARMTDVFLPLYCGSEVVVSRGGDHYIEELQTARPTIVVAPPFLYNRIRDIAATSSKPAPYVLEEMLGNTRFLFTGASPVPQSLLEFFRSNGIVLREGYGMTESSSLATLNLPGATRAGTQGRAVPGVMVQTAPDGEIELSGPNVFAGYWKNEAATSQAFHNGWLRTGDLGYLDDDGYLHLRGRSKDMLVLASGRRIHPTPVEQQFARVPGVAQAVLVGEGRGNLCVLLSLEPTSSNSPSLHLELDRCLAAQQRELGGNTLSAWHVVEEPFTVESGELTALRKPSRRVIHERRQAVISQLCGD
jgi:long-chain acyl-CoA synthetase